MVLALKHLHLLCVVLSVSLFIWRFARRWWHPNLTLPRWAKIAPHLIDTVLLSSALGMLYLVWGNPFHFAWLRYKIVFLFLYIVFGSYALKRASGKQGQALSFAAALLCVTIMVCLAFFKDGFFIL